MKCILYERSRSGGAPAPHHRMPSAPQSIFLRFVSQTFRWPFQAHGLVEGFERTWHSLNLISGMAFRKLSSVRINGLLKANVLSCMKGYERLFIFKSLEPGGCAATMASRYSSFFLMVPFDLLDTCFI